MCMIHLFSAGTHFSTRNTFATCCIVILELNTIVAWLILSLIAMVLAADYFYLPSGKIIIQRHTLCLFYYCLEDFLLASSFTKDFPIF